MGFSGLPLDCFSYILDRQALFPCSQAIPHSPLLVAHRGLLLCLCAQRVQPQIICIRMQACRLLCVGRTGAKHCDRHIQQA